MFRAWALGLASRVGIGLRIAFRAWALGLGILGFMAGVLGFGGLGLKGLQWSME